MIWIVACTVAWPLLFGAVVYLCTRHTQCAPCDVYFLKVAPGAAHLRVEGNRCWYYPGQLADGRATLAGTDCGLTVYTGERRPSFWAGRRTAAGEETVAVRFDSYCSAECGAECGAEPVETCVAIPCAVEATMCPPVMQWQTAGHRRAQKTNLPEEQAGETNTRVRLELLPPRFGEQWGAVEILASSSAPDPTGTDHKSGASNASDTCDIDDELLEIERLLAGGT